jgi:hypothetical protein
MDIMGLPSGSGFGMENLQCASILTGSGASTSECKSIKMTSEQFRQPSGKHMLQVDTYDPSFQPP